MTTTDDLHARLRRLEDHEAIRSLIGTYALRLDDRDFVGLGACFTPDAGFGPDDGTPGTTGREAIMSRLQDLLAGSARSVHANHDMLINLSPEDPDQASGTVLCHAETSHQGHRIAALRYRDLYRREQGVWRIADRRIRLIYSVAAEAYPGALS